MLIDDLMADLKRDEGFRSSVYLDSEGWQTIGYGTLVDIRKGAGITPFEAEYLARNRIQIAIDACRNNIPLWQTISQNRQCALVEMTYNLGIAGLMGFRNMLAAIKDDDWAKVAAEALNSKWARQVGQRAQRIADLLIDNEGAS
jgi:lysozyme